MRIISVEARPVALVLSIAYGVLGLSTFVVYVVGHDEKFTLPLGVVLPLFHLNINFTLVRSSDLFSNAFLCLCAVSSYAVTGWITGLVSTLGFNLIAARIGGIDAKYVSAATDEAVAKSLDEKQLPLT